MTTRATKKTTVPTKSKTSNALILKDLSLQLLSPEQFEAITRANYYHPESRLVLQLFLHVNWSWQIARKLQNKPSSVESMDWALIEKNTASLINNSLSKLLPGVDRQPWNPSSLPTSKPPRKTSSLKQACGCSSKHSNAAGVVAACQLGKAQGADESWTGY